MFDKDMPDHGAAHLADAWATEAHAFLASTAMEWWRLLPAAARAELEAASFTLPV
jgi:hypothetical protein